MNGSRVKTLIADLGIYCSSWSLPAQTELDPEMLRGKPERRRITVFTYEDRTLPFVSSFAEHNRKVATDRGYEFLFQNRSPYSERIPPHWIKVFAVRDLLEQSDSEFVMWLDSDAMLCEAGPRLEYLLQDPSRHFWAAKDPPLPRPIRGLASVICAGVWIVRASDEGRAFMNEWAERFRPEPWTKLEPGEGPSWRSKGIWTMSTYEQGQLSVMARKHRQKIVAYPHLYFNSDRFETEAGSPKFAIHLMGKNKLQLN